MKIGQLINSLVIVVAATALAAWSFVSNPAEVAYSSQEWVYEGGLSFDLEVNAEQEMTAIRNNRDSIVLLPGAKAELNWSEDEKHVDVFLSEGGVLFGTQANDFSVSVHTSSVRVESQESLAYVALNEGKVSVYGLMHPSLLSFVEDETDLNALFVPSGMMIEVAESKVTSTLARLRLTKLSKEFRASDWEGGDFSDEVTSAWMAVNLRYTEQSVAYAQSLQSDPQFGPVQSGLGSVVLGLYDGFREFATVTPSAQDRLIETNKQNLLTYAMSNLLFGESSLGELWVKEWEKENHELEDLESLYSDLFFVLPGDELYSVKASVVQLTFDQEATFSSLRRQFLEVESLLARGESLNAQNSLAEYQLSLSAALDSGVFDDPELLDELSREYLLVERLLRENSNFYNVHYVELLTQMEDKILSLAGGDTDLAEERQAFVLSKIQFLTKLFEFVVDRRVSVDDATDLANELLFAAEGYMILIPTDVAVRDWYMSELEKADLAIAFIGSPEFYSYSDFDEGLKAYELKLKDLDDLQAYIQQIRDGNGEGLEVDMSLDEALEEVRQAFTYNAISYVTAESHGDSGYRLFQIIDGKIDAYAFEASYDREGGLLYDLVIEGQIRFSTGILLEDLGEVIEQALLSTPLDEEINEEVASETSLTEDLAIHQVKEAFESADLDSEDFSFEVLDLETNTFSFEGTITRYSLPISGEYTLGDNQLLNVIWTLDEDSQSLPEMDLSQVESAVQAVYEALTS